MPMFANVRGTFFMIEEVYMKSPNSIENTPPRLALSVEEAIEMTGLGRTFLWKAVASRKLKCFKVGRRVLFSPDHLKEFLELHQR